LVAARWLVGLALLASCSKEPTGGPSTAANPREATIAAWKTAGLSPSAFMATQVAVGKDCQSGTVSGVDVVVCTYASDAEAKAAEEAGLAWVGETTGMAQARGKVLVAAADRKKADPQGKTINSLMKLAGK